MVPSLPADPSPRAPRRWLDGLLRSGGTAALLPMGLPLVSGGLLLAQAAGLAHVLQGAIRDGAGIAELAPQIAWIAALMALRIGLGLAGELAAVHAAESIKARLRGALIGTLMAQQPVRLAAKASGALSTALVEHVDALEGYLVRYLPAMVQASILPLAFAIVLVPTDWMVGLLLLLTMPLIPLFMALAGWGAAAATAAQAAALARLGGRFADRLRGLTTLSLFGRADAETEAVATASEELRVRTMRVMRIAFLSSAVLEFFAALGVAGVALYTGLTFLGLVSLRGGVPLPLEAGLFCLLMAPEAYAPLRLLAAHYHDRAAARAAVDEIARQAEALPGLDSRPAPLRTALDSPAGGGHLVLHDLSVATPEGRPVVSSVSLDIRPGQSVAIVGASGVGKSTLLEAIARLRDGAGSVEIDGEALAGTAEPELRARLAMLGQSPRIFAGTIADNIRLGRRDAGDGDVRRAAERACVTDFSDDLPDGLGTTIGEDGLGLSGGELQRVALARIYLRNPGVVLLDEPTAHLDALTEARVLDGLMGFARGRTLVVATHSPAVAARMQRGYRLTQMGLVPLLPVLTTERLRGAA